MRLYFALFNAILTAKSAIKLRLIKEHEISNELVRNETNSGGVSSFKFVLFVANFFYTRRRKTKSMNAIFQIFASACDFTSAQICEI